MIPTVVAALVCGRFRPAFAILLVLATVALAGARTATAQPAPATPSVIERPEWSVGDWWEFQGATNSWRLTVVGRHPDHYLVARSSRGEPVDRGEGRITYHFDLDGWLTKTIAVDGKVTDSGDKFQWVKFPLQIGNRWFFSAMTTTVGRSKTDLRMLDFDARAEAWETIEVGGRSVRAIRMSYSQAERGRPYGGGITGWYAPEAKRLVRLTTSYAGGYNVNVIAFGGRDGGPSTVVATAPPKAATIAPPASSPSGPSKLPVIALNYPPADLRVDGEQIVIVGLVTADAGVGSVQLTVNGAAITTPGEVKAGSRGVPVRATVKLVPGANVIEITATDTSGNAAQVVRTITRGGPTLAAAQAANRLAVIIGIGQYDNRDIPPLRYAERDADAMYQILTTLAGFKKDNVLLLTDRTPQRPTLRNIKSALGTFLARNARKDDTVLVYFAGHGAPEVDPRGLERDGLAKYLVPRDADPNDLYATALSMEEIQTIFGRIEAERIVVFVDSCYSGAAGGRTFASNRIRTRDLAVDDLFLERLTRAKGRAIITASRPSEVSLELSELGHGLFTYYLVEGMKGAADTDGDGIVTLQELYTYVEQQVSAKSRAVGGRQHPVLKGEFEGPLPLTSLRPR